MSDSLVLLLDNCVCRCEIKITCLLTYLDCT